MLSKKKEKEINEIGLSAFSEVVKGYNTKHDIAGTPWYDTPPDMWTQEEREVFDLLTDLQIKITNRTIALFNKKNIGD